MKVCVHQITPAFKKASRNLKNNYRPISILSITCKIFEKLTRKQISNYFGNIFSKFQCGFWKGFSTQNCFLLIIDKWKKQLITKPYRWHHYLCCCKQYSRSTRESNKHHAEALYLGFYNQINASHRKFLI